MLANYLSKKRFWAFSILNFADARRPIFLRTNYSQNAHTKQDITVEQRQLDFDCELRNHESGDDAKEENDDMLVLIIRTAR